MIIKLEVLKAGKKRWSTSTVRLTSDKGDVCEAQWSEDTIKQEQLKIKLLLAGANEADLEEYGSMRYNQGIRDEEQSNAESEAGGSM